MSEMSPVDVRQDARGVAWVTIENAPKLNTLNRAVMTALIASWNASPRIRRCVRWCCAAPATRAFIGGADIGEMAGLDAASARAFITLVHRSCDVFRRLPVPAIACIQGWALGAGLEVAAACDLRFAGSDARFGMPEVRVGVPSVVEAALLPGLIGWGRTRRLLLTGETIDAATALSWGLVEEVVPAAQLNAAVERALDGHPRIRSARDPIAEGLIGDWEALPVGAAIQRGIDCFASAWETDEPRGLMQRFLDHQRQRKR